MKKNLVTLVVILLVIAFIALSDSASDAKHNKIPQSHHSVAKIPSHAIEVIPGELFWLGVSEEKGRHIEGYAIIHREKGFGKSSGCNNDGKCQGWESASCGDCASGGDDTSDTSTSDCFGFLGNGAKWRYIEDVIVEPQNVSGLRDDFVRSNLEMDISKWEDAADGAQDDDINFDIMGHVFLGTVDGADMISPDGDNEVLFANIENQGAIAITIVWGIFRGPPKNRELIEIDMIYDDYDFDWSEDCVTEYCVAKMDFENIATHELGHAFGLNDLYTDSCLAETMYGYATVGETSKRSLESGDINGVYQLYK